MGSAKHIHGSKCPPPKKQLFYPNMIRAVVNLNTFLVGFAILIKNFLVER